MRNEREATFTPNFSNPKYGTRYLHPLVALPHLRFTLSAINTKWEGDCQPDVALPLNDQPANDSISEVGVRLNRSKRQEARGKKRSYNPMSPSHLLFNL